MGWTQALERARRAWPGIEVDAEQFEARLEAAGDDAHAEDLYLAVACTGGDAAGRREAALLIQREVPAAVARTHPSGALTDDVVQRVVEQVVVGNERREPAIAQYAGRGPLRAWIRIIALREARRLARERVDAVDVPVESLTAAFAIEQEVVEPLKASMRASFKESFENALASLSAWDRDLLRQHLLEGRSIDTLAARHKVHRATVARWLGRIRTGLHDSTQSRMRDALGLSPKAFASVMSLIGSRLDASFERVLGDKKR